MDSLAKGRIFVKLRFLQVLGKSVRFSINAVDTVLRIIRSAMTRVTTIAIIVFSVVPNYFAGQANFSTVAGILEGDNSISLFVTADVDVPEDEKQQGQVHPLPQICSGRRCYQHYDEALRCCPGYRCSFRLPFLGGMCIRDLDGGTNHTHHETVHFTEAPPAIEHTHSSLQA